MARRIYLLLIAILLATGTVLAGDELSNAERIEKTKQYMQEAGVDNELKAAKLLRAVTITEEEEYILPAYTMLAELKEKIRSRYPQVTDEEYAQADKSVGRALLQKGDIDYGVNALVEEAGCLSSAAQIQMAIMYQYHVEGYPKEDPRILKFYEETAQEGLARSQFFLGQIYLNGWGVPKDEAKARQLLEASEWEERGFKLAENSKKPDFKGLTTSIAEMEIDDMNKGLQDWSDPKMIESLSGKPLTDQAVKDLYREFLDTVVTPPDPDDVVKEYGIENGEERLAKTIALGKKIHNLGQAISGEEFEKYSDLLRMMRDILYLDSQHIPLAIKHDHSRDFYWYDLHNRWLEKAKKTYNQMWVE